MRSRRPLTTPRHSRSKALAALALERTQAVAGLGCHVNTGCVSPEQCRAAGGCQSAGAGVLSDETGEPE